MTQGQDSSCRAAVSVRGLGYSCLFVIWPCELYCYIVFLIAISAVNTEPEQTMIG
jgi:hypothetical protein